MPTLEEKTITSFSDYSLFIESLITSTKRAFWYRGVDSDAHPLLPRLYRNPPVPTEKGIENLMELEAEMADWFKERSIPFCARELGTDWDTLFFMQHFGMPTRLLDWTENPIMALYFALASVKSFKRDEEKPKNMVVWVLEPRLWNKTATYGVGKYEKILFMSDRYGVLEHHKLGKVPAAGELMPLAIYGAYNSSRIVAQRGVFIIFGSRATPMEQYFQEPKHKFDSKSMIKILIPFKNANEIFETLLSFGITESTVFPDLDQLAKEGCRLFGFGK